MDPIVTAPSSLCAGSPARPRLARWCRTGIRLATCVAAPALGCLLGSCSLESRRPLQISSEDISTTRPFRHWALDPATAERQLADQDFRITAFEDAGGGVTGASKVELVLEGGERITVKWKPFPPGGDDWNNSPRKEIAAYEIQKWFLDPEHYVVPTTVVRCVDLEELRPWQPQAEASFEGSNCLLVTLSVWLEGVTAPEDLYDEERFRRDSTYAFHIANLDIVTTLIDHRDGRRGNFLRSKAHHPPRFYAIDNGIAFSSRIWNYFARNWNDLRVPALPRESVARLRQLTAADYESMAVIEEFRLNEGGIFRTVAEPMAAIDRGRGVRWKNRVLQLGLQDSEIDEVRDNVEEILEAVDSQEVELF